MGRVLLDACSLENFAVVKRLDLLQQLFEGRASWTSAVEREVMRGFGQRPYLEPLVGAAWLGEPIDFDEPAAIHSIERIRLALGGSRSQPFQHLGEAQAIYYLDVTGPSGTLATDDRAAYALAQRRGLSVIDTPEILSRCYQTRLASCPDAFDLVCEMADSGRGVSVPPTHWHICPPTV